jgi:ribonucleoside-diphosphate reductase beta chain
MAIDFTNKEQSYELFDKAKRQGTWDPADIDLTADEDHWETVFDDDQRQQVHGTFVNFYEGEESVTKTLTPFLTAIDALEDAPFDVVQQQLFLTTQLFEEAKHTDFFSRYFEEVIGTQRTDVHDYEDSEFWQNPELRRFLIDDLEAVTEKLRRAVDEDQETLRYTLAEALMHYMGLVEAQLAKSGYAIFETVLGNASEAMGTEVFPGFQEGITNTRKDEGRHITNGRWVMQKLAEEDPAIVTEVYEPKIEDYLSRLTNNEGDDAAAFDIQELTQATATRNLQQTIDSIGEERFQQFDASIDIAQRGETAAD